MTSIKTHLFGLPNSSRHYLELWAAEAGLRANNNGYRVLDAGAGEAPYRDLFKGAGYETADFGQVVDKAYGELDHVCDLTALPMADAIYDMVFCSQTLEHLNDPGAALREFYRVLKPGGEAWLSAPLFYEEHEQPFDFYRYTQYAWRELAAKSGFSIRSLEWLEGYYGTLSYQLYMAARQLPSTWMPTRLLLLVLAKRMAKKDKKHKLTDRGMCKNYRVVLVKPE